MEGSANGKYIAIVCNPLAGAGKAVILAEKIATDLSSRKIPHTFFMGNWPLSWDGFTDLFIVGGDGTLNYFINHYPDEKLPLVIFNGGTGNDFHWMLYGKTGFEKLMEIALSATPKPIDAGKCNDRYFLNALGIGFDGEVARSLIGKKKWPGKTSFMIAVLKKIFFYRSKFYKITVDKKTIHRRFLMISIMNGRMAGGGFNISPESLPDDGLLNVVLVEKLHPLMRLRYLPVIEKGKHLKLNIITHFNRRQIMLESDKPIVSHLDGEYYTATKMEVTIMPGKFRFRF